MITEISHEGNASAQEKYRHSEVHDKSLIHDTHFLYEASPVS